MMSKPEPRLDLHRFRTIIDAYGTDSSKWPQAEREAALALLRRSPEAEQIVKDAARLDRLLGDIPVLEPSAALKQAIANIPATALPALPTPEQYSRQNRGFFGALWKTAAAATLAMVLGVITGVATMDSASATSDNQADWEDFSSLAFVSDLDQELSP